MQSTDTLEPIRLSPPPRLAQAAAVKAARNFLAHVLPPLVIIGLLVLVWQVLGSRPGASLITKSESPSGWFNSRAASLPSTGALKSRRAPLGSTAARKSTCSPSGTRRWDSTRASGRRSPKSCTRALGLSVGTE